MPLLHVWVTALQIGHDWMNVLHVLPGQSASVMQPKPAFAPPAQDAVSQAPEPGQSGSLQHGVSAGSGARQRPVSLTQVPPPPHATVSPQVPLRVQFAPGVVPPEQRIAMRSPLRKIFELSGKLSWLVDPVEQSPIPVASLVIVLTTQLLVAAPL